MRTASPFANRYPYVALGLRFLDGNHKQFDDVSAPASDTPFVQTIADEINERL